MSREYDSHGTLERAMVWHLLRISACIVAAGVLIWYGMLLAGIGPVFYRFIPYLIGFVLLLPITISLSAKGTLAEMEAGAREGIWYFFWAILWQLFFFLNIVIIFVMYALRHRVARLVGLAIHSHLFVQHHFVILLVLSVF